ncbi:TRAP transporter substrate-binding protein DctP [Pontivivens nitratireducens]|uniref:TRAP transporter substrate-binding protein DctP n=1 Tax=Pontivivens nitratireducens TaxID=2758038 RepID=UPI0016398124|nr:TRAP transporter substrate-binding protein DctP [Pontibrevibacter nitratireducens]
MKLTKSVLLGTALALGAGPVLIATTPTSATAAEVEGPEVKWNLSLWGARRGFSEGLEGLAQYVSEQTDGNFEIELHYGEVLSASKENLDGLYLGAFEAAAFCPIYHPAKTPALSVLDLAFLPVETLAERRDLIESLYQDPAIIADFAKWKALPLMGVMMPNYQAMGAGDPPTTLEDWQGLRISSAGGVGEVMAGLGASVTLVTAPDMFQSLERGMIEAATFPYTYAFASYRLHEVSDWVTDNWSMGAVVCHSAMSESAYNALPEQYKTLLDEAVEFGYDLQIQKYNEVDVENEALFEAEELYRVPMTDEIDAAIAAAVQPSWDAWIESASAEGVPAQELLDKVLEAAAE